MSREKIHIVAIVGSVRPGNFTRKALDLVIDEIEKTEGVSVEVIDPADMNLPLPGQAQNERYDGLILLNWRDLSPCHG